MVELEIQSIQPRKHRSEWCTACSIKCLLELFSFETLGRASSREAEDG